MRIDFRVDGIPKAQPRAEARRRGKFVAMIDPGTADYWKGLVVSAARPQRPELAIAQPTLVKVDFFMPRPKKLMRRKDPDEAIPHTGKPDVDNLAKAVLDAMKQDGWFVDDSIVFSLMARKFYTPKDGRAGAAVTVLVPDRSPRGSAPHAS